MELARLFSGTVLVSRLIAIIEHIRDAASAREATEIAPKIAEGRPAALIHK
jgi:hypothetical protein